MIKEKGVNWYICFVQGGKEKSICRYINEKEKEVEAFIPSVEIYQKKEGQSFFVKKLMFPSYVFIKSDLGHSEFQIILKRLRNEKEGFIRELKHDNEDTTALLPEERDFLEKLMNKDYIVKNSIGIIEGNQVVIRNGPLQGYESMVKKVDRHKRIGFLEVDIFGKIVRVKVGLEVLKKI